MRQHVSHDAGITNYCSTHNAQFLSHACCVSETSVRCVLCCAVRAQMCRASGCSVYTYRRLSGSLSPGQPKLVPAEKNFTNCQTVKNAKNSNFLSFTGCFPNSRTRTMATKATGFSTLVYSTSILFEGRPHSRILQFLRTVVLFSALLAGFEECFYIPAGSPYVRRVISCILFSLEQSRIVDLTAAEDHPDSISESNVLSDEFAQLSSQCIYDYSFHHPRGESGNPKTPFTNSIKAPFSTPGKPREGGSKNNQSSSSRGFPRRRAQETSTPLRLRHHPDTS